MSPGQTYGLQLSYLTGYPLPDAGYYALARTWPAPEQPRPGCVWTHTLLIEFADLAALKDLSFLLKLFRRPEQLNQTTHYQIPIIIPTPSKGVFYDSLKLKELMLIITALYEFPHERIFVVPSTQFDSEQHTLAIWAQQWPRLRRTFRFCTFALNDRSSSNTVFDLQILPEHLPRKPSRGRFPGMLVDLSDSSISIPPWAKAAAQEIVAGSETGSREFLWRFGSDMEETRSAFSMLLASWHALTSYPMPGALEEAVTVLEAHKTPAPSLTRFLVEHIAAAYCDPPLGHRTLRFLIHNLSYLDECSEKLNVASIAHIIWMEARDLVYILFRNENRVAKTIAATIGKLIEPVEAFAVAHGDPEILAAIVATNPLLAVDPQIWQAESPLPERVFDEIKHHPEAAEIVVPSMLSLDLPKLVHKVLDVFAEIVVKALIERLDTHGFDEAVRLAAWIKETAARLNELLNAIASGKVKKMQTLAILAAAFNYRHLPISNDRDCWASALTQMEGRPEIGGLELCTFLLARGLSGASPQPGILIGRTFDPIYAAPAL